MRRQLELARPLARRDSLRREGRADVRGLEPAERVLEEHVAKPIMLHRHDDRRAFSATLRTRRFKI